MSNTVKYWIKEHLNKSSLIQGMKISLGVVGSILIAKWIGIDFAPSTGIVTLLGIQETRRETLQTALRRVISFCYTILFAYLVHEGIGVDEEAFALVVVLVVLISIFLGWADTMSINIVIAVHLFMMQRSFDTHLIVNETERVLIGVIIALLINWRIPRRGENINEKITELEESFACTLMLYEEFLRGSNSLVDAKLILEKSRQQIQEGKAEALVFYNNILQPHAKYYLNYIDMRKQQLGLLFSIYRELSNLQKVPQSGIYIAKFMNQIAETISAQQPLEIWQEHYNVTYHQMNTIPIPKERTEFREQVILYSVLNDLEEMIRIKRVFISGLSEIQKQQYWTTIDSAAEITSSQE